MIPNTVHMLRKVVGVHMRSCLVVDYENGARAERNKKSREMTGDTGRSLTSIP